MFIWQYIDIPQEEISAIQQEMRDVMPSNEHFFQHVKLERKTFLGLEIFIAVLVQAGPGFGIDQNGIDYGIHRDLNDEPDGSNRLAINIPLDNCEESITKFWHTDKPESVEYTRNGMPYITFQAEDCKQIDEFKLTRPIIFDTYIPHNVVNPQSVWRRAISIRFKNDPWHLIK